MKGLPDYNNDAVLERIVVRIHSLRDRKIVADKLVHGLTYEQLAEYYDLSVSQVKRIVKKGIHIVFK